MENLHPDITSEILSHVPPESVLQCKLVCKTWLSLLRHRKVGLLFAIRLSDEKHDNDEYYFGNVQLYYGEYEEIYNDEHYSFKTRTKIDHPPINKQLYMDLMIGSCNGLVCFSIPHHGFNDPVYICNPISGEYVNLPELICKRGGLIVSGFGYLQSTNEYKIVRIYFPDRIIYPDHTTVGWVQIYTLGSGTGWRNIGVLTDYLYLPGVLANGALHWMDDKEWKIVILDLADEEFRLLPSPPCIRRGKYTSYQLKVLGGNLCVIHQEEGERVDIWAWSPKKDNNKFEAKEKDHHAWSWNREFSIPWQGTSKADYYEPFALTKSNEVLLWYNQTILYCYEPKTATLKRLVDEDTSLEDFQAIPHMNTTVSLKTLGLKSMKRK